MPLNTNAKMLFDLTAKDFIRKISPQQLEVIYSDKKKFLDDLLSRIRMDLQEQQRRVSDLYKTAKDAVADKQAYDLKTQIEGSPEFSILSCSENELLERFDLILNNKKQPDTSSVVRHSIFPLVVEPDSNILEIDRSLSV